MNCRKALLLILIVFAAGSFFPSRGHCRALSQRPTTPIVVLLHGIYDDKGAALARMKEGIEIAGYQVFMPPLRPSNGELGLPDLAIKLKAAIDQNLGPKQPFFIVAYSMGGLIGRYYLEELGGISRCRGLITVSTPYHGTIMTHFIGGQGGRDMLPGSAFLHTLQQDEAILGDIPITTIWNPMDLVVFPAYSSYWHRADSIIVFTTCHSMMIRAHMVVRTVVRRLKRDNPLAGVAQPLPTDQQLKQRSPSSPAL